MKEDGIDFWRLVRCGFVDETTALQLTTLYMAIHGTLSDVHDEVKSKRLAKEIQEAKDWVDELVAKILNAIPECKDGERAAKIPVLVYP